MQIHPAMCYDRSSDVKKIMLVLCGISNVQIYLVKIYRSNHFKAKNVIRKLFKNFRKLYLMTCCYFGRHYVISVQKRVWRAET